MTDRPYTDEDLRTEAASCLSALAIQPTAADIRRSLPDTYIDSHRTPDSGREATWAAVVGEGGLGVSVGEIQALINGAADVSEWAINLGADGLEPYARAINIGWNDGPLQARIHIAFPADTPASERDQFVTDIADAIAGTVPVR